MEQFNYTGTSETHFSGNRSTKITATTVHEVSDVRLG